MKKLKFGKYVSLNAVLISLYACFGDISNAFDVGSTSSICGHLPIICLRQPERLLRTL
jgi:hypothetical protein